MRLVYFFTRLGDASYKILSEISGVGSWQRVDENRMSNQETVMARIIQHAFGAGIMIIGIMLGKVTSAQTVVRAGPIDVNVATISQDYLVEFSTGERERHRAVYVAWSSFYMAENGSAAGVNTLRCQFRSRRWVERRTDQVSRSGNVSKGEPVTITEAPLQEWWSPKKNAVQYKNCNDVMGEWMQWGQDIRQQTRDMLEDAVVADRNALSIKLRGSDTKAKIQASN